MTERPPADRSYISISERLANIVRSLSLTNVLMIALLLLIAAPAYFAWKFMTDEDFRTDFMTRAAILDKHVPCIVFEGQRYGSSARQTILVVYGLDGRNEKVIGLRAPGTLSDTEIDATCQKVLALAEELKK